MAHRRTRSGGETELPAWSSVYRTLGPSEQGETFGCGCGVEAGPVHKVGRSEEFALVYLLVVDGHFENAAGERWPLRPGCLYLEFPGQERTMRAEGRHAEAFLSFGPRLFDYLESVGLVDRQRSVVDIGYDRSIGRLVLEQMHAMRSCSEAELGRQMAHNLELCMRLLGRARGVDDPYADLIEEVCQLLAQRLDDSVRLEDLLAERFAISYERLRKLFRQRLGLSPGEYRIRRRIDQARDLLLGSDDGLEKIALQLGYSSPCSFSRQFKKGVGGAPTEFSPEYLRGRIDQHTRSGPFPPAVGGGPGRQQATCIAASVAAVVA